MTTPLNNIIIEDIQKNGPMPLDTYMAKCLYDENHGYYMTQDPFGTKGDFTTAPEITQMFGEMIGAWIADTWIKMGKPQDWTLVECGAGRGTLMADILRTLKSALPEAYETMYVSIVEISPFLKQIQRDKLNAHTNVRWHQSIDEVDNTRHIILVANELLDAFPIKQYSKQQGAFYEKVVTYKEGLLQLDLSPAQANVNLPEDALIAETSPAMESFLCKMKDTVKNGAALFIDYGGQGYGDTLQALKDHQQVDIFTAPGESDITTHVNFDAVRNILGVQNTSEPETLGTFLTDIGLPMRAAMLHEKADAETKASIEQATHRLLHPEQMGNIFKAIAYRTNPDWDLAAFAFQPHINNR